MSEYNTRVGIKVLEEYHLLLVKPGWYETVFILAINIPSSIHMRPPIFKARAAHPIMFTVKRDVAMSKCLTEWRIKRAEWKAHLQTFAPLDQIQKVLGVLWPFGQVVQPV
jgi:hypothetical protein